MARRSGSSSDDAWCSDGDCDDGDAAALAREAAHRDAMFHSMGYREGIDEGKAAALQAGFDAGFAAGASAGFTWGQARGAAEALRAVAAQHPAALAAHAGELAGLGEEALRISPAALPLVWPDLQRCLLESRADEAVDASQPLPGAHAPQPPPARDSHSAHEHACGSGSCCGEPVAPPGAPPAAQPGCGAADCCGGGDCGDAPAPAATGRAAAARAEAEAVRAALRGAGARLRRLGVTLDSWEALSAKPRSEAAARGALAALRVAPAEEGEDWGW
jgi:hypothetical protein